MRDDKVAMENLIRLKCAIDTHTPQRTLVLDSHSSADMVFSLDMAIKALQAENADGCDGCKYVTKDEYEMPCLVCKRNHMDKWRPCE